MVVDISHVTDGRVRRDPDPRQHSEIDGSGRPLLEKRSSADGDFEALQGGGIAADAPSMTWEMSTATVSDNRTLRATPVGEDVVTRCNRRKDVGCPSKAPRV